MRPFAISLPGVLRLRALHSILDHDGGCSLVYDAERGAVFEVPEELRFHVAPALDMGDLDEELLGWLSSEDLLTGETFGDWSGAEPGLADLRGEVAYWVDCAPGGGALDDLDFALRCARGCPRLRLHLDWVGNFPPGGTFETLVGDALRRAAMAGQAVSIELSLDACEVTPEVARRVAAQPVDVRLRCGESDLAGPPTARTEHTALDDRPWLLAEPAVKLLLAHLAPAAPPARAGRGSLTVQCLLQGASRLIELWRWAMALGIRHLDAIRLEEPRGHRRPGAPGVTSPRLREYREDLLAIQEETAAELEAGRRPPELQSLTRTVRHLMCAASLANLASPFASPLASLASEIALPLAGTSAAAAAAVEPTGLPCRGCWANQICSHSAFVGSPQDNEDPRGRSRETCGIWASEVEAAIRLHHRLAQIDPMQVSRFLAPAPVCTTVEAGAAEAILAEAPLANAPPPWVFAHLLRVEPS